MRQIQRITSDSNQTQTIALDDNSLFTFSIYYIDLQYGWFITSLSYGSFILQGIRICNSPNLLQQYRNQIPFGLACYTSEPREPTQQQDFSSGTSQLYVLNSSDVAQLTTYLTTGVNPG